MAVDLSVLAKNDREDFQSRLATYGLDVSVVHPELSAPRNARISLTYGREGGSFIQPTVIEITDFDDLNRMIGVDDRVFRRIPQRAPLPRPLHVRLPEGRPPFLAAPGMNAVIRRPESIEGVRRQDLDSEQLENIRTAARAYLRGNSHLLAGYKPIVEKVLGTITLPIWCFLNIRVASGSTLAFGPGVNVLIAYRIEIENGGRIVSQGHLTVNCTILQQPPLFRPPRVDVVLREGLTRLEE